MDALKCIQKSIEEQKGFPLVGKQYELINSFYRGTISWENLSIYTQGCLLKMSEQNPSIKYLLEKIDTLSNLEKRINYKVNYKNISLKEFWKHIDFLIGDKSEHLRYQYLFKSSDLSKILEKINNSISSVKSGHLFALTDDNMDSIDSFALKLLIFIRMFRKNQLKIKVIYNTDGTIRMHKLNRYGTKIDRLLKINQYINEISLFLQTDIPGYVQLKDDYWVPCIYIEMI